MRAAAFIPIKAYSERVPGKNLRVFCGRPLYQYIIDTGMRLIGMGATTGCYVDTDSDEVAEYARGNGCSVIERLPELAKDTANGNDLLLHHASIASQYDIYCQLFATAPYLKAESIAKCIDAVRFGAHDSAMTVTTERCYCWHNGEPVTYKRGTLPRSQDMEPLVTETTGCYAIHRDAMMASLSRVGYVPCMVEVSREEATDINTEADWQWAEELHWRL